MRLPTSSSTSRGFSSSAVGGAVGSGSALLEMDPVILLQLLELKDHSSVESVWGLQPRPPLSLLSQAHLRKERERRPQVVRRSAPDSAVLLRLKAQMAEVRNKMCDVKSHMLDVRESGDTRPGPSGAQCAEELPSHPPDPETEELELRRARAAPSVRKSLSPVLDSSRTLELQPTDSLHVTGVLKGEAPAESSSSGQTSCTFSGAGYSSTGSSVERPDAFGALQSQPQTNTDQAAAVSSDSGTEDEGPLSPPTGEELVSEDVGLSQR